MAPPSVSIGTAYPGATAEVIANQVAAPIEAQLNGIDNLLYFSSTSSSSGNVGISVVLKPGSDPDINQVNVQNRVSQALSLLPATVAQQGVSVDKLQVQQSPRDQQASNQDGDGRQQHHHPGDESARHEQQRKEMLRRMWRRLSVGSDPLDLVA